jgi:hypothetical protein
MKVGTALLITALFFFAFTLQAVGADVVEPGKKEISYYYQISNITSYPDYIFLLHGSPSPSYQVLNSSEFSFYKFSTVSVYAVRKSDFNQVELENMNASQIDSYFKNNIQVIPSNTVLKGTYGTFSSTNPLEKVLIVMEIVSLNSTHLELKKYLAKYVYSDGTVKEAYFQDQNTTPTPPDGSARWSGNWWYFALPLAALIGIITVILRNRKKN